MKLFETEERFQNLDAEFDSLKNKNADTEEKLKVTVENKIISKPI